MLTQEQLASAKAAAMKCVDKGWTPGDGNLSIGAVQAMIELDKLLHPALIVELIDRYNLLTIDYEDALDRLGQAQRLIEAMRKGKAT